jgi:hypothetical protein
MSKTAFGAYLSGTFNRGASITSFDTTVEGYWGFLKVESKTIVYEEGENVMVRITFTGSPNNQYASEELAETAQPTYSLNCSLAPASLAEHPKFKELSDNERSTLGKLMAGMVERTWQADTETWYISFPRTDATDPPSLPLDEQLVSANSIVFAELIAEGESTYLRPTITWTETTQGNAALNASQLNKLGRIATPRGNPPEPNGDRDWMLTNATQDQRGELYQTRIEWTLSERGGHNAFLYDT